MTVERAIEILDPNHREHYGSIETVNEAYRMGMKALEKQKPKKIEKRKHGDLLLFHCPTCNDKDNILPDDKYCSCCGQALDWEV